MDFFAKFESVSKSLSLIMVPVVIAVAGYVVNGSLEQKKMDLERDKLNQEMTKKAADVIFLAKDSEQMFGPDASLELRRLYRAHWIKIYNAFADFPISNDLVAMVQDRDALALPAADKTESKGWVVVGIFEREQPYLNFDVVEPEDGKTLAKDVIIRARWSVPVRTNTDNPDGANSPLNPAIGRLPAGHCAKVVDFNRFVRQQAWAFIEPVKCSEKPSTVARHSPNHDVSMVSN
jgi:hypothetical protein